MLPSLVLTWSLRVFSGDPEAARGTDGEAETGQHTRLETASPGV